MTHDSPLLKKNSEKNGTGLVNGKGEKRSLEKEQIYPANGKDIFATDIQTTWKVISLYDVVRIHRLES